MVTRRLMILAVLAFLLVWSLPQIPSRNPCYLLQTWCQSAMPIALLALAAGIMISVDRIDISIGSAIAFLGGVTVLTSAGFNQPLVTAIAAAFTLSATYYLAFWWFCCVRSANSLLFSLGGSLLFGGAAIMILFWLSKPGQTKSIGPAAARLADCQFYWFLGFGLVVALLWLWRFHTLAGIKHLALGVNAHGARLAGLDSRLIYSIATGLAAVLVFLATLSQIVLNGRGGWSPQTGPGLELIAIAVTVLGGTRLGGGQFDPIGTTLAAITYFAFRETFFGSGLAQDGIEMVVGGALWLVILVRWPSRNRAGIA